MKVPDLQLAPVLKLTLAPTRSVGASLIAFGGLLADANQPCCRSTLMCTGNFVPPDVEEVMAVYVPADWHESVVDYEAFCAMMVQEARLEHFGAELTRLYAVHSKHWKGLVDRRAVAAIPRRICPNCERLVFVSLKFGRPNCFLTAGTCECSRLAVRGSTGILFRIPDGHWLSRAV